MSTPKQIFKSIINKTFNEVIDALESDEEKVLITYDFKTNIVPPKGEEDEMFDILNNMSFSGTMAVDIEQKLIQMYVNTKYENSDLANLKAYVQEGEAYISLGKIFDKYISMDIEKELGIDYDDLFETTDEEKIDDMVIVLKRLKKALNNSLEDEYFEKDKKDGMTKNTLVLDFKDICEMSQSILKDLKDDKKFIEAFAGLIDKDEDDVEEMLDELLDELEEIEDYEDEDFEIKISIYTKGLFNSLKKVEVKIESYGEEIKFVIEKEDKENYSFELEYNDGYDKESISGDFKIVEEKDKTSISFMMEIEGGKIGFDLTYSIDYKAKISKANINDSIDYEDFIENDENGDIVLENITNNETLYKFITDIEDATGESILPKYDEYTLNYDGTSVTFKVLEDYELDDGDYNYKSVSNYDVNAYYQLSSDFTSYDEYFETVESFKTQYETYYSNVKLSERQSINIDGRDYYYVDLSFDYSYYTYYQRYLCSEVKDGVMFYVVIQTEDTPITNSLMNDLL